MDACDECQFDYASEGADTIPDRLRTLGRRYGAPLSRFLPGEDGVALLRSHPVDGAWSALEYACHVRDVFEVQAQRVAQILAEDTPTLAPMRRDERVLEMAYNDEEPAAVAGAIAASADALAGAFERLTPAQWQRTGVYAYPSPAERPLLWVGQHTIHEAHHHLLDVGRTMKAARGR